MCTISGFWFREQLNIEYLSNLLSFGKLRGTDGLEFQRLIFQKKNITRMKLLLSFIKIKI